MRRPRVQYRHGIDVPLTDACSAAMSQPFAVSDERDSEVPSPCRRGARDSHVRRLIGAIRFVGRISDDRERTHTAAPSRQGRDPCWSRHLRRQRPCASRLVMDNGVLMAAH